MCFKWNWKMAHDVAKYILHHVESDNLSKLKIYLCKYYRFNYQLQTLAGFNL